MDWTEVVSVSDSNLVLGPIPTGLCITCTSVKVRVLVCLLVPGQIMSAIT